jgi:hypothetical protein
MNITCNGEVRGIQANLYYALQRIRHRDRSRLIWADALCIDQSNKRERGHQVRLMGSIAFQVLMRRPPEYRKAILGLEEALTQILR